MNEQAAFDFYRDSPVTPSLAQGYANLFQSIYEREHLIAKALAHGGHTHTANDITDMISKGQLMWWPLENSFMVTEILSYPRTKHYHVFLAGGDLEEVKATQPALVNAAKLAGCSAITLSGRRGWVKALADLGWQEKSTAVAFKIED